MPWLAAGLLALSTANVIADQGSVVAVAGLGAALGIAIGTRLRALWYASLAAITALALSTPLDLGTRPQAVGVAVGDTIWPTAAALVTDDGDATDDRAMGLRETDPRSDESSDVPVYPEPYTLLATLDLRRHVWALRETYRLARRLVPAILPDAWERTDTAKDVMLVHRTRVPARWRGLPHVLTANRLKLIRLRLPEALIVPAAHSRITLKAPARAFFNPDPPPVGGGSDGMRRVEFQLSDDAIMAEDGAVTIDLADGFGRTGLYVFVRTLSVWEGFRWLLGTFVAAVVALLVQRRRAPEPVPREAEAVA